MLDKHPFWSKGAVSSPLSHFWHILCFYFVWIWLTGVEGLIPLVSLFWTVDDDFSGRGLSTHSCLIHSLYTSRVLLHPQCPCYCQMSISGKHCEWINFLCVSVRSCMCVSTCCVHHTWAGGRGQLWSLFGVRLPVSVIHQGRYPAGAHMNTCIEANAFTSITSCGKCLLYIIYTVPTILTHFFITCFCYSALMPFCY